MVNVLDRYGGWPVVKGDEWASQGWNWMNASMQIVSDGFIDLILACHIEVNPKNSSEFILVVRCFSSGFEIMNILSRWAAQSRTDLFFIIHTNKVTATLTHFHINFDRVFFDSPNFCS